jgi:hypothetical protein
LNKLILLRAAFSKSIDPGATRTRSLAYAQIGTRIYFFVGGLVDPVRSPGSSVVGKQPRQITSLALRRLCSSASICSRTAHQAAEYGRRSPKAFSLSIFGAGFEGSSFAK